jgi:hypothetical protein
MVSQRLVVELRALEIRLWALGLREILRTDNFESPDLNWSIDRVCVGRVIFKVEIWQLFFPISDLA